MPERFYSSRKQIFMLSPINSGYLCGIEGTLRPFSCRVIYLFEAVRKRANDFYELRNCASHSVDGTHKLLQLLPCAWCFHHLIPIDSSWIKSHCLLCDHTTESSNTSRIQKTFRMIKLEIAFQVRFEKETSHVK